MIFFTVFRSDLTDDPCRISGDQSIRWNITDNNGTGGNNGIVSDGHTAENGDRTVFHPYYDEKPAVKSLPVHDRIIASAYTNSGKMLLAVLNDTDKTQNVTLSFDFKKLGVAPGMKAKDVWNPKQQYTLKNKMNVKVSPRGFVLIPFVK